MLATACLLVHGCETVDGGAVELSWKLRPSSSALDKQFVNCESGEDGTGTIKDMRLYWTATTDDGRTIAGMDEWPCDDSHGVTGFDLPVGTALLSLVPVCEVPGDPEAEYEALPGSYIAPAVEQRRVTLGDTVSLGALEIVVVVSDCERESCICE